jgi:hypothetical protein
MQHFNKGYNFASNLITIGGLHAKLCAPKVVGLPLGSPGTKRHLDVAPMDICRVYYKREGGGFPQVRAMVSLVSQRLLVVRPSTKSLPSMH